jgi:nitrogen fixation-related uncharacterized protein
MIYLSIIGIVLGIVAIGLFFWLKKEQKTDNGLHEVELHHTHQGMNALINDINNYQVETDRKIAELEKQLTTKTGASYREIDKLKKELPSIIGKVVGQIEFAQDKLNRKL